ncbi:alpha/beta hydrolase [Zafaria sp. Z1313]|uniref:alpha/beta hydrolase n=1 Tax=unclassified Zafaria TaxID=2828765 RepID=UPI002E7AAC70|nr:alpha/beta hydrolase [Zafaria sp. J156]MEE1622079.1 alpha/beta hydrolase [Zafaria sp. J156]
MKERIVPTHDGGRLALYSYGNPSAPGERRILVVGGAFITALIYRPFALALSKRLGPEWAVDVYDRRGRGSSTGQPADYSMDTEIADVALMLRTTGARNLFGHSLGGAVVLNAVQAFQGHDSADARFAEPALVPDRLAVYDPAINIDGSVDSGWIEGFREAVKAGRPGRALARMQRGMATSPTLSRVPEPILAALLAGTARTPLGRMARELLPTGVGELTAALEEAEHAARFARLPSGTRFMAGAKSPAYFRATAQKLHRTVGGSGYEESPKGIHASVPAAVGELIDDIAGYFEES